MNKVIVTIFTPTYNRANTLTRLYKSLCVQTNMNFEWLVIDDESNDNTEKLIKKFQKEEKILIRYYKQKHGGKHRALNKAFSLAKGKWFFTVDSDDFITNDAIEKIISWTKNINDDKICGVSGIKILSNGNLIGNNPRILENDFIDATNFDRDKYCLFGDKAEVYLTKILKENMFPEFDNEFFITEDVCFQEIAAKGLKIRWYNTPIYICEYLEDGLTKCGANAIEGHKKNYKGYCYWIMRALKLKPFRHKYSIIKDYVITGIKLKKNLKQLANDIDISILKLIMYILLSPLSYILKKIEVNLLWKI